MVTVAGVGTIAGAVYVVAVPLAVLAGEIVPHAGEQGVPLCVKVQVTPLLLGSFVTVGVNCCVALTFTVGFVGEMLTLIGGAAVIVIVADANLVVSTGVAVRVTVGVPGTVAGAV